MANDTDWVADVKRWYLSTQQEKLAASPAKEVKNARDLGLDPVQIQLAQRRRPQTSNSGFADLK